MRVAIDRGTLSAGLAIARKGAAPAHRAQREAHKHVLVRADAGRIQLSGCDGATSVTAWFPATVEEEGALTVPAAFVSDVVGSLPDGQVDLSHGDERDSLAFACMGMRGSVRGLPADAFEEFPTLPRSADATVSSEFLRALANRVVFAADTTGMGQVLAGVKVEITGGAATLVAADRPRVAVSTAPLPRGSRVTGGGLSAIVPAVALAEFVGILPKEDTPVTVALARSGAAIVLTTGAVEYATLLIDGPYINYEGLLRRALPTQVATKATLVVADLKRALRTAAYCARASNNTIYLRARAGQPDETVALSVGASAADWGDARAEVDAIVEGGNLDVAYNMAYLQQVLDAMPGDYVSLEVGGAAQPTAIRAVDGSDYLCLVMPLAIPRMGA